MSSEILADADHKMSRAVDAMERDFQGVRTGRASTALVERIHVEYYGTSTPLNQLAGISVPEPHQIVIQPWDRAVLGAIEAMDRDLQGVRTGRASTSLVERITVDYYGTQTPLNQLAGISVPEPHQIVIQPWDRGVLGAIEKAITKSEIGLMPNVDGTVVRLNIPPLTEDRRKDLVKSVHRRMEEAKVEIRNLRRDAADEIKKEERDGTVGTDESHRQLDQLQKTTDRWIGEVDRVGASKEQEVMEV